MFNVQTRVVHVVCRIETINVPIRYFHIRSANFLLAMRKQIFRLFFRLAVKHKILFVDGQEDIARIARYELAHHANPISKYF